MLARFSARHKLCLAFVSIVVVVVVVVSASVSTRCPTSAARAASASASAARKSASRCVVQSGLEPLVAAVGSGFGARRFDNHLEVRFVVCGGEKGFVAISAHASAACRSHAQIFGRSEEH